MLRLAAELGLSGRLCERTPPAQLEELLGLAAARRLAFQQLQLRAVNRALAGALSTVVEVAGQKGVEVVLLKHAALWASGAITEGQRDARDIDVLVSETDAETLWQGLCAEGYRSVGNAGPDYHLPALVSASGACVELHHRVWGVELAPDEPVTSATLVRAGLTAPSPTAAHVHVPVRDFLIAHALVHGLAQHLTSPSSYAPLRVIGDLFALGAFHRKPQDIARFLGNALDVETVQAALDVARALANGASLFSLESDAAALLSHIVAASSDRRYGMALRAHRLWELHERGELLRAGIRFLTSPASAAIETPSPYAPATLGERAREGWELLLGVLAHAQLRKP